ncbi:hypothetical protein HBH64_037150 [Parastagonospora nodorum]|nr:hypothetical protein HBH50_168440 [Parastagonospora nodorum]KAH4089207.1 hypothetical protein HBH48_110170 [Parastagonospora nodorum]KAH4308310.1 hypothetical protein HBI01_041650 [Parastagonospora nodorum]KAH4314005.1 hypothetical protein HBI02_069130 [Parastagonospora nodorum]KAH4333753.1 hypothetical protein HBI00_039820 [Parastagonospora nodorum]
MPPRAKEKIPLDSAAWSLDKRNPVTHILRVGYPPAQTSFYENKVDDVVQPMPYTMTKFVRGLDMTPLDFYRVRERAVIVMHEDGFMNTKMKNYEGAWAIQSWIHKILAWPEFHYKEVPELWNRTIIIDFLVSCQRWYHDQSTKSKDPMRIKSNRLVNVPKTKWEWAPDTTLEEFDGYYQYQHLEVTIHVKKWGAEGAQHERIERSSKLCSYFSSAPLRVTQHDLPLTDLMFAPFRAFVDRVLVEAELIPTDYVVSWFRDENDSMTTAITDDMGFVKAVHTLRKANIAVINLFIVNNTKDLVRTKAKKRKLELADDSEIPTRGPRKTKKFAKEYIEDSVSTAK